MPIHTGSRGLYQWLTSNDEIDTLLQIAPEVVLGKYVAITLIDSGFVILAPGQKEAGWRSVRDVGYSPKVGAVGELLRAGYDEWYVFDEPPDLGQACRDSVFEAAFRRGLVYVFVNYGSFVLHDPRPEIKSFVDLFGQQLSVIEPRSYISEGRDCLTLVTRDEKLFASVSSCRSLLILVLQLIQLPINSADAQQRLMRAAFA
jgi:hypothetical protein